MAEEGHDPLAASTGIIRRKMSRILLWYWGRRGGGAQFALGLARALRPHGVALPLSRQNALIDEFRTLPVPRQEMDTSRA